MPLLKNLINTNGEYTDEKPYFPSCMILVLSGCASAQQRQAEVDAQNRAIQQELIRQQQAADAQHERDRWNNLTSAQQHEETVMKQNIEAQKLKLLYGGICWLAGGC